MKLSLNWLSDHVDLGDKTPQQILDDLTMSTAEVEGIEEFAGGLDGVVVGHVVEREKHPDADKLSRTRVDVGQGEALQIVCGAPNVAAGQKVAVVLPGATLPGGIKIKKTKIRGVESSGMICSEVELGLSEEGKGILVLDENATVGTKLTDALGCHDHVLEIDNKSINHRPDLWGHHGIARELAAIYGRPLRPACERIELPAKGRTLEVHIDDLEACPRYCGLVLEGVRALPSPDWLRWRLAAVGQRPIDLLVDLTNYVMLDLGQPMHGFDLRQLDAAGIGVRRAREGETMVTLDGVERRLTAGQDLLITSGDRPVALAGIMGGEGSMVAPDTSALFLESANFHPATIRRASARLGLRTDSSARFEKALDPAGAELAVHRFVGLLQELCPGAHAAGPMVDPSGWAFRPRTVRLRKARLDLKLGVTLPAERVVAILEGLEFGVTATDDGFDVGVPSWRATKDVTVEDDLIEEVGRMFRYDNIPEVPLVSTVAVPPKEPELWLARNAVRLAAFELGSHETYDYSFVPDAVLDACRADGLEYVTVTNPIAPEIHRVRRHVLPSLLGAVPRNLRSRDEVRLFEEGRGYHPERRDEHGLPFEVHEVAFAWARRDGGDLYPALRAGLESLCRRLGYAVSIDTLVESAPPWVHPGRTAALARGDEPVGFVGVVHPQVAHAFELPATTAVGTVDLRALLASGRDDRRYAPIATYPPQPVDVALLVDRSVRVGDVARFLADCGKQLVRDVRLFEVYVGEGIPDDKKSVNFTVTLGAADRTLSAKDEEKYLSTVRQRASEIGAELRG